MPRLTIEQMLELGWTWQGPFRVADEAGEHFELRIEELPDFFLAAETYAELVQEIKLALRAYLQSYLERGEDPHLPRLDRWEVAAEAPGPRLQTSAIREPESMHSGPIPRPLAVVA